MFFVQHQCSSFKKELIKHQFCVKRGGGLQQNIFKQPVFCKMWKAIVFLGGPFLGKFWLMLKNHYKIGISAYFEKQKEQRKTVLRVFSGPSKGYYLVQVWPSVKMANLDQILTVKKCARNKMCWNPHINSVLWQTMFKNKLGPDHHSLKVQTWIR